MGRLILGSQVMRHYQSKGPACVEDENIWQEMTECILTKEGISPITSKHREIMAQVRKSFLNLERAPGVSEICTQSSITKSEFFALFPDWAHTLYVISMIVCYVMRIPLLQIEKD